MNQETNQPKFHLSHSLSRWILIGVGILLIIRLGLIFNIPFTDTTEARYAEIARKMVETNDWITPQFDYGVPFWGKPPLHTWVSALGMKVFGVNSFGARIGIFLSALALLVGIYRWGRREKGSDYALAGTFIVGSSVLFYLASATVMTDLMMIMGTTLCMISFWDCLHSKSISPWSKYLFFIGIGIGMLSKGPVAVVLSAIPIGMWVLLTQNWVNTWKKIPWITGLLLSTAIFAPWYYLAEMKTPGFLDYFIIGEHYHRFIDSGWKGDLYGHGHAHPKGSIWLYALATWLPWTPFILWPLVRFKKIVAGFKAEENKWSLYLLCWALSPMLFFTMASNILATYVFSGIPAIGFLALELWQKSKDSPPTDSSGWRLGFMLSGIAAILIAVTALVATSFFPHCLEHRTQKFLVQKVESINQTAPTQAGHLYYWHKRFYSAEFYTEGKVVTLKDLSHFKKIKSNSSRDFLVIRKKNLHEIPPEIMNDWELVQSFRKNIQLYQEKP